MVDGSLDSWCMKIKFEMNFQQQRAQTLNLKYWFYDFVYVLCLNTVSSLSHPLQHEPGCDEDDDCCDMDDDEIISTMLSNEEKFYPGALEKMIGCVALLLEEARDGP